MWSNQEKRTPQRTPQTSSTRIRGNEMRNAYTPPTRWWRWSSKWGIERVNQCLYEYKWRGLSSCIVAFFLFITWSPLLSRRAHRQRTITRHTKGKESTMIITETNIRVGFAIKGRLSTVQMTQTTFYHYRRRSTQVDYNKSCREIYRRESP